MSKWLGILMVVWGSTAGLVACSDDGKIGAVDGSALDAARGDASAGGTTDAAESSDAAASPDLAGSAGDTGGASDADAGLLGAPITAAKNTWTWVDFPDSSCDEGSPTGIGINPGDGPNLFVYHEGGGACWDYTTCYLLNTAVHGPYGSAQFAAHTPALSTGTLFDRANTSNPFRDYTFVYVPYCTGDLHAGDNVATYGAGVLAKTYHHSGRRNVIAYLARIAATFPQPGSLVVGGSSAGGFGAVLDYDLYRTRFPAAKSYLLDDSGPFLEGDAIPAASRTAWYAAWGLDKWLGPQCPGCQTDMAALTRIRLAAYPNDRMALVSSLQDATIRTYFMLSADAFQTALLAMAHDVFDPSAKARYFFVPDATHTTLGTPAAFMSKGTDLLTWLTRFVSDDPTWTSTTP